MKLADLIRLMTNRLATLNGYRTTAESNGDLDRVVALDVEIAETEATLSQLQSLA